MGDPAMTEHLGGPETPEQLRKRHARYLHPAATDRIYVITVGSENIPAGSVVYWERVWQGEKIWEIGWGVLPEFQGQGLASKGTALAIETARTERKHRYIHAFPSIKNGASNAICRKLGFELLAEYDFEYPKGHWMRCNDWRLDLFS